VYDCRLATGEMLLIRLIGLVVVVVVVKLLVINELVLKPKTGIIGRIPNIIDNNSVLCRYWLCCILCIY